MEAKVTALERDTASLLACAQTAEETGNAGRRRAEFQRDARALHERGTLLLLEIDAMQVPAEGTDEQRDAARSLRKKFAVRVQASSTRLSPFL